MTDECVVCGKYARYEFKFSFCDHSMGLGKWTSLNGMFCADCGKKRMMEFAYGRSNDMI